MNYAQIRAFHMVAREGSVGRAAEVLGVSQPTVSQHLKGLETRHGVGLFEKRGRNLVLTDAGDQLFSMTRRLTEQVEEIDELLERRPRAATGRLRIHTDSPPIAIGIVSRLMALNPKIDVQIRKDSTEGIVASLMDMRADVGIAVDPIVDKKLLILPYRYEELWACLPSSSPLARRDHFAMETIATQTLILREPASRTRALIERILDVEGKSPAATMEIEGSDVVREAVACGLGMSFFAESECLANHRVAYRKIASPQRRLGFAEHIIIRRDRRRVTEIAEFLAVARPGPGKGQDTRTAPAR